MKIHLREMIEKERAHPTGLLKKFWADNLRYWRKDNGYTQEQAAQKLCVAESTYANWEQGRREPSITDYYYLMYAFDINANDLFFGLAD